jgi:hypothetical protein
MLKPADTVSTISTVGTVKAYQEASGRIIKVGVTYPKSERGCTNNRYRGLYFKLFTAVIVSVS